MMIHFKHSTLIDAPVDVVWNFHERPDILELLTPPWQPIQVLRREGGLNIGAVSEFRIFVGPIPLRWVAVHTECEPYHLFVDDQREGPFQYWQHRHQFQAENGQTRLTDAIAFSLPGGWFANLLIGWVVYAQLIQMFRYRHAVTKRQCEEPT